MKRGEVWWVDLGEPRGSAPALERPVVVVQTDALTRSKLATIMVVPVTTNMKRAAAPGNVVLSRAHSGLKADSVAMTCQVMTVDKHFFVHRIASLPTSTLDEVDDGLRLTLHL
jgi:mRNA interferase MazF